MRRCRSIAGGERAPSQLRGCARGHHGEEERSCFLRGGRTRYVSRSRARTAHTPYHNRLGRGANNHARVLAQTTLLKLIESGTMRGEYARAKPTHRLQPGAYPPSRYRVPGVAVPPSPCHRCRAAQYFCFSTRGRSKSCRANWVSAPRMGRWRRSPGCASQ